VKPEQPSVGGTQAAGETPRSEGVDTLRRLERLARVVRRIGLGGLVDRVGPAVGSSFARMRTFEVGGIRLRGNEAGHLWYLREVAEGREAFLAEIVRRAVTPGRLAVDGGAHLGHLSLIMAQAGARVIAFEPSTTTREALLANVRRNGLSDVIDVRSEALGRRTGTGFLSPEGSSSTLAGGVGEQVRVASLDEMLLGETPALLKLDLEGWEVEALRGMERILAGNPVLLVECNEGALRAAGSSGDELLALLGGHGYAIWQVDEAAGVLRPGRPAAGSGYVNLLCVKPGSAGHLDKLIGERTTDTAAPGEPSPSGTAWRPASPP
jgi:FkbM family methyltransferase